MKSVPLFSNISKAVLIDNFKRLWGIPALSFIVYFLSGVFPILMNYSRLNEYHAHIDNFLNNSSVIYVSLMLFIPVAAAAVIFRYLHNTGAAAVMHSLPFNRKTLFCSHFITGILMIAVPVFLNGLILLAISKPVLFIGSSSGAINIFSRLNILNWMWQTILSVAVIFSISVFSAMVTGSSLLQVIFSIGFAFLAPVLSVILIGYFDTFIYGFSVDSNIQETISKISPLINIVDKGDFSAATVIWYIASFAVICAVSYWLYIKRAIERASDSIAFNFLKPVFSFLAAFGGMSILGFYFMAMGENKIYIYPGFFLGSLIAYIIAEMIIRKNIWVFKHMKGFLVYLMFAAVFLASISFDLTGYERRIPASDKIEGIYFSCTENAFYDFQMENKQKITYVKDKQTIESLLKLHGYIVENRKKFKPLLENSRRSDNDIQTQYVSMTYRLKNGALLSRNFIITRESLLSNPQVKELYESKPLKKASMRILNIQTSDIKMIVLSPELFGNTITIANKREIDSFIKAYQNDILNEKFESIISGKASLASAEIEMNAQADSQNINGTKSSYTFESVSLPVKKSFAGTIKWLMDHGYYNSLNPANSVKYVTVQKLNSDMYKKMMETEKEIGNNDSVSNRTIAKQTDDLMVISDPDKLSTVIQSYESNYYEYRKDYFYYIKIYSDNGDMREGWFSEKTVPSFIAAYFKNQ